ncbi:Hypothetical predicted protein [Lecanosticta acicola]|uniref:Uncharacterized protein n=1 Tax=Lecanosticta acicola TaxID=111012 RepID=A0AAI8YSQ0_9PEZI|nr:Hypothetical predicted protein [Lecanosticta acicola]
MEPTNQSEWTAADVDALCCEISLLVEQVRRGRVDLPRAGDFYSTVSSNLLRRHNVHRSATAASNKYAHLRAAAIESARGVDERPFISFIAARSALVYPGEAAPAPPTLPSLSAREQQAVLKWTADWGLDIAE